MGNLGGIGIRRNEEESLMIRQRPNGEFTVTIWHPDRAASITFPERDDLAHFLHDALLWIQGETPESKE